MPIQIEEENDGRAVAVRVTGKLVEADYQHFVPEIDRLVRRYGKLRVLFDLTGFHGWEPGALWDEIKLDVKHFADIERLAIVGDKKWEHGMATFFKPFTTATIRYFDLADEAEARKWWREP
jgi:hypothetical protein